MSYYLKVWLFTILVSPLIIMIGVVCISNGSFLDIGPALLIWLYAIIFGSALALPALFVFRLLYKDLVKRDIPVWLKKFLHAFIGNCLLWITFYFLNKDIIGEMTATNAIWPLSYSLCLILGAFIYKVNNKEPEETAIDHSNSVSGISAE